MFRVNEHQEADESEDKSTMMCHVCRYLIIAVECRSHQLDLKSDVDRAHRDHIVSCANRHSIALGRHLVPQLMSLGPGIEAQITSTDKRGETCIEGALQFQPICLMCRHERRRTAQDGGRKKMKFHSFRLASLWGTVSQNFCQQSIQDRWKKIDEISLPPVLISLANICSSYVKTGMMDETFDVSLA